MWFLRIVMIFSIVDFVKSLNIGDYASCCPYCSPNQAKWIKVVPTWKLVIGGDTKISFLSPTSVTPNDAISDGVFHDGHDYRITYGGAPISIIHKDTSAASKLASGQYIEINFVAPTPVAGVTSQGGFFKENLGTLFRSQSSWMSSFAVSYFDVGASTSRFINEEDGSVKVFKANDDAETARVSSFYTPVMTTLLRVHPLSARNASHDDISSAFVRVGAITCSHAESCERPKLHCEVNPWQGWGPCQCAYVQGCHQKRTRSIYRHNACGGRACPHLEEFKTCLPPEPLESQLARYLSIGTAILVVIVIIIGVIARKQHLKKKVKMFRQTRESKERARQEAQQAAERKMVENAKKADNADFDAFAGDLTGNQNTHRPASTTSYSGRLVAVEGINPEMLRRQEQLEDEIMDEYATDGMTADASAALQFQGF